MTRAQGPILLGLMLLVSGCATERAPGKNTVAVLQDADLAYTQGNWSRAESQYRLITQRVPGDAYAWFKLGNLYLRTDRANEAIYAYQQTLARDNTYAKAYHNLALLYLLQGRRTLEAGIKADAPNDPQLPASRALLTQLTALVDGPPVERQLNTRAINRVEVPPVAPGAPMPAPAHSPQPIAALAASNAVVPAASSRTANPVAVNAATAQPEPDPVIIEVDADGQTHRLPAAVPTSRQAVSAAETPIPAAQTTGGTRLTVLARSLTLRAAPTLTAAPVLGLNRGDLVMAMDTATEEGWRQVRFNGQTGWAYAKYLRELAPAAPIPTAPAGRSSP